MNHHCKHKLLFHIEYFDKKEKQIELQKKIQHSNQANASRLSILKARDDYIQVLKEEARQQLIILTQDRAKYIPILGNLISQGLMVIMEREVTLRCRYEDYGLVQRLIPHAIEIYKQNLKQDHIQVMVDNTNFLSDDL